jgi:hypothetical protein
MIKNKVLDVLPGQTEENIKETGKLESSTARDNIFYLMDNQSLVNGIRAKKFVGLRINKMKLQFIDI